jgi:Mg-chelatase subunit ChlD
VRNIRWFTFFTLLILTLSSVQAQSTQSQIALPPTEALLAYQCTFDAATNRVSLNVVTQNAQGRLLSADSYTLTAQQTDGETISPELITIEPRLVRPPLQIVLVLDLTDTVPLAELVATVTEGLLPSLQPQDQIALITFSEEVAPPTVFYTDKARLAQDFLTNLSVQGGDNRVYDAMAEAIRAFPFGNGARKVILTLTDSGRRTLEQVSTDDLIAQAQQAGIQIYPIAFITRDRPDADQLSQIANETGGYFWYYDEPGATRSSTQQALTAFTTDFHRALNSEAVVSIDVSELTPDNSSLPLTLSITGDNGLNLSTSITCPYQQLRHDIRFLNSFTDTIVSGTVDIAVSAQSDLAPQARSIIFRFGDEIVQNSDNPVYSFNAATVTPGYYTVEAQIWGQTNNTLATTPTRLRIFAQQALQLQAAGTSDDLFSGALTLEAFTNPAFPLPAAEFSLTVPDNPALSFVLGRTPFDDNGRAAYDISDIGALVTRYFPDYEPSQRLAFRVTVPNVAAGDPPLAASDPLTFTAIVAPPATATPQASPTPVAVPLPPRRLISFNTQVIGAAGVGLFFLLVNILLFRAIRRRRIQRIIMKTDKTDISPQLMTLTVYRGGVRQPYTLTKKTVTLGRGSSNDINLGDDPNISRQHGVVMWRRGGWYYSNRKANLSTRVDGSRRRGYIMAKLEPVIELQIGSTMVLFHSSAQQDLSDFIKTDL